MLSKNKKVERNCPSCQKKIIDERDEHWDERLICAYCCAKAYNCRKCEGNIA